MTSNNETRQNSWVELCKPSSLGFRSACNAAVPANFRPVKLRVINNLSESREAHAVFDRVWRRAVVPDSGGQPDTAPTRDAGASGEEIAEHFHRALAENSQWQTLVAETIAADIAWSGPFSGTRSSLFARVKEFAEKLFDRRNHPVATTTATVAAAFSGCLTISIAVSHAVDPVKIPLLATVVGDGKPVTVPVEFRVDSNSIPIGVNLSGNGCPPPIQPQACQTACQDTSASCTALTELATSNTALAASVRNLGVTIKTTTQRSDSSVVKAIQAIGDGLTLLKTDYDRSSKDALDAEQLNARAMANVIGTVAGSTVSQQAGRSFKLHRELQQSVVVPTFDNLSGLASYKILNLCLEELHPETRPRSMTIRYKVANEQAVGCSGGDTALFQEGLVTPIKSLPWGIVVNSIDRHWYGSRSASITLTPMAEPQKELNTASLDRRESP